MADVLTGSVLPSGHLTDTWPLSYTQYPTAKEYSQKHFNGNIQTTMGQQQEQVDVATTTIFTWATGILTALGRMCSIPLAMALATAKPSWRPIPLRPPEIV